MLNVLDTDYELEYSESYTGTVYQEIEIEGYQYFTSLKRAFESLKTRLAGCISLSHLPKTVDVCGAELSFNVFSDNKEGLLCNSLHRKSIFENAMINNTECTGFLMRLSCYCISCIYNPQRRENICIPSWYTMKITYNQFSILGTQMVQLHSLRQLAVFIGNEGS